VRLSSLVRAIVLLTCAALTVGACAASNAGDDNGAPEGGTPDASQPDGPEDSTIAPDRGAPSKDAGPDSSLPPEASASDDGEAGGSGDASNTDAVAAPVGSACSPVNSTQSQPCEGCGTQQRICLPDEAGTSVWQAWGACLGQIPDACAPPGAIVMGPCGRCGKQLSVCQLTTCTWAAQACNDGPDAACYPGTSNFVVGVSCDAGGRWSTCQTDCTWGAYGACAVPDAGALSADRLVVPSTVGNKATGTFTLDSSAPIPLAQDFACPSTFGPATPYGYVELINETAKTAVVSIWHSQATGGSTLATVGTTMATYTSSLAPLSGDEEGRAACSAIDQGPCYDTTTDPSACASSFAGLMIGDMNQVTVPAGAWIWIYSASQMPGTGGPYQLTVMTNSLQ
jgi:hypothetical protein